MALLASLREIRSHVIRVSGSLVIGQVATHAGGIGDVVVVVDVAIRTLARRHSVHSG